MERARGMDVMFLCGETPTWHMHVSAVVLLDPSTAPKGFGFDRVRDVVGERLSLAPQAKLRLVQVPLLLDRPVLVPVGEVDLARHVRHVTLSRPGSREQLGRLVGEVAAQKLDRSIPLWEVWVIDGLEGGRVALMTKMSHALVDGVSGADLTAVLFDLQPDAAPIPAPPPSAPEPFPSAWELAARGVLSALDTPRRGLWYARQAARQGAVMAGHLRRGTTAGLPLVAPRTPFNRRLGSARGFAFSSVTLEDVRQVKDRFGVKVNDVVLALVAGALRTYLLKQGDLPGRPLVAEVPVSIRTEATRADIGTQVGTMFVSLATDLADPVARLRAIARSAEEAKVMRQEMSPTRSRSLAEVCPPAVISLLTRAYTASGLEGLVPPLFNLIVSNVAGPPVDLYLAGARVDAVYPLGPLLYGSGVNATAFSVNRRMDFGFLSSPELISDPWLIADGVSEALAELAAA